MDFCFKTIPSVLKEDEETGWKVYMLFSAASPLLKSLFCHVAVLSERKIIHPLHQHQEEEMILIFSGEVDNIVGEGDFPLNEKISRVKKGSLIYLSGHQPHTLRAVGPGPATILAFKWEGRSCNTDGDLLNVVIANPSEESGLSISPFLPGSRTRRLIETPTRYLKKLSVRIVEYEPGVSFGLHRDRYDLALVLLNGNMNMMGVKLKDPTALFVEAGTPHWMQNPDQSPTSLLVVEFHKD
jgi:quercetin dioxygenase-like cupin family protein